jgi:hypothetical protein
MKIGTTHAVIVLLTIVAVGCGDNLATDPNGPSRAPRNLSAFSSNETSVSLSWAAPTDSADSSFTGFQVKVAGQTIDLPKTARSRAVTGLPMGEQVFEVVAKRSSGTAESATIRWAPAARFTTPIDLPEFIPYVPLASGMDVGDSLFTPTALSIEASSQSRMDLYLQAFSDTDTGLTFKSARIYNAGWRPTAFSTVSHAATNAVSPLDYPLKEFPGENTFSVAVLRLTDNTIFYALTVGADGTVHYARLYVRITPGLAFPSRRVTVQVSLQRAAGVRSA